MFNNTFGEKLKLARQEAGMSREEVAKQIIVSESTIAKWEQGKHIP